MGFIFEWDSVKAESNERKHGVAFPEAGTVFNDELALTFFDPAHSVDENRYVTIGRSATGRLLVAAHTQRGARIRLISAREATDNERRRYEDAY